MAAFDPETGQGEIAPFAPRRARHQWLVLMLGLAALGGAAGAIWALAQFEIDIGLQTWALAGLSALAGLAFSALWPLWSRQRKAALIAHIDRMAAPDPDAVVLCDGQGQVIYANPAAQVQLTDLRLSAPKGGKWPALAPVLDARLPNAAHLVARGLEQASRGERLSQVIDLPRGQMRANAWPLGRGRLVLWRFQFDTLSPELTRIGMGMSLPAMLLARSGGVLAMNQAAHARFGRAISEISELVEDMPLQNGQVHRLKLAKGRAEMRLCLIGREDDLREAYFLPVETLPVARDAMTPTFDILPVALVHIGAEGQVLAANRPAQRLLGIGPQDLGCALSELIDGLGRPLRDWIDDMIHDRVPARPEVMRARRAKGEVFLQVNLGRISSLDRPDQPNGRSLLAVLHDATELKQLEEQFAQSQKMQAIGALAGGVAHDFNNVLTAISGHTDLLMLRHDRGDPDFADLEQIRQNTNRAASLVGQLLAFSRKQSLTPETLDLRDCLSDLMHLLNRLVGEKVQISVRNDPDLAPVRADRRQFEQVVMNLVVNARDALPQGGVVQVETRVVVLAEALARDRALVPAGRYVTLSVRDGGIGIPADKRDRIFEPFYTTKPVGQGTGLGLSMVYGIVKQTGGYIFVDSVEGEGTEFIIYLPAHDPIAATSLPELAPPARVFVEQPAEARAPEAQKTILLVEDEAPVRAFATRALRLRGHHVLEADCAESALDLLSDPDLKIDLFVTDVVMPGRDGPSWVKEARQTRPDIGVVFVSGYAEDVHEKTQGRVANSVFLPKPFSLKDLTQTVDQALAGKA